jgi:hypothetical protein
MSHTAAAVMPVSPNVARLGAVWWGEDSPATDGKSIAPTGRAAGGNPDPVMTVFGVFLRNV